jgi:hypothetical protein
MWCIFRPFGACIAATLHPRLAPWAAFLRRSAALLSLILCVSAAKRLWAAFLRCSAALLSLIICVSAPKRLKILNRGGRRGRREKALCGLEGAAIEG